MGISILYCCYRPKKKKKEVQVIISNGEARHFYAPITIRDLLLQYPHHYCVPHAPGTSLSADDELEGGNTYLLLPLPRLFPDNRPASNSLPCDKGNRAKTWEPSLHMIAENDSLMQPNTDHKSARKQEKKIVKPASIKPKHTLNRNAWYTENAMCIAYVGPSGLIF